MDTITISDLEVFYHVGVPDAERRALEFSGRWEREFLRQPEARRSMDETFSLGWGLLETLPRHDLMRIGDATWAAHEHARAAEAAP